jgi:hypothetical protein
MAITAYLAAMWVKRFMLRGIQKVSIETGLIALAHNLRKKAA